mmetsp:Transcript_68146/g.197538  ORF Transcript_68146/g.197538 Transcript_68146/m.197538 type:complete len:238 (-) Transcript_68146:503-1216(-)
MAASAVPPIFAAPPSGVVLARGRATRRMPNGADRRRPLAPVLHGGEAVAGALLLLRGSRASGCDGRGLRLGLRLGLRVRLGRGFRDLLDDDGGPLPEAEVALRARDTELAACLSLHVRASLRAELGVADGADGHDASLGRRGGAGLRRQRLLRRAPWLRRGAPRRTALRCGAGLALLEPCRLRRRRYLRRRCCGRCRCRARDAIPAPPGRRRDPTRREAQLVARQQRLEARRQPRNA